MELKEEHRRQKIAAELQKEIGHAPLNAKEKRVHAAATAVLAGDKKADVQRVFAVRTEDIQSYINRAFPEEEDQFKFLEKCAVANAILSQGHFMENYKNLTPEGSARAFGIFADAAIKVRKARESGFQEAPVNVNLLLSLQQTLERITPAT